MVAKIKVPLHKKKAVPQKSRFKRQRSFSVESSTATITEERTERSNNAGVKKIRWNEDPQSNDETATTDAAVHETEDVQSNSAHEKVRQICSKRSMT